MPACPDRDATLAAAREAVEVVDRELAEAQLGQLVLAFGCGSTAAPDVVAEFFLLEGVMASYRGDDAGLLDGLRAASGASASFWLPSLGPKMQERFLAAAELPRFSGQLVFEPALDGQDVFLDGQQVIAPITASDGLHLVQAVEGDQVVAAWVVSVPAQGTHVVEHTLGPWRAPVVEVAPVVEEEEVAPRRKGVVLHGAVGAGLGIGQGLSVGTGPSAREERAARIGVPLELGLGVYAGRGFVRGAVGAAPQVGGELLYEGAVGPQGSPVALGGHLAGGLALRGGDVGLLTGPSWPGRWQVRALAAVSAPGPFQVELRAGLNLVTERAPEPAGEVMFTFQPAL